MNRRELLTSFFAAPVVASVQSSWFALPQKTVVTLNEWVQLEVNRMLHRLPTAKVEMNEYFRWLLSRRGMGKSTEGWDHFVVESEDSR